MNNNESKKSWVIHFDLVKEVELSPLNGSPYGSYLYSKQLQCAFYSKDVYDNKDDAIKIHNKRIFEEINRLNSYIEKLSSRVIEYAL